MNSPVYNMRPRRESSMPNVVFALLILNLIVYVLLRNETWFFMTRFALWPLGSDAFMPWQLVSYSFLHDPQSLMHIAFNMLGLYMFGRQMELVMGSRRFLVYYLVCVVGAGIVQLVVAQVQGGLYPTVGASGGLMGVLLAFAIAFPNQRIMLIFPPIPIAAKYFVPLFGLISLYLGFSGNIPGVAHFAHLGGMLFGFILLNYWSYTRRRD